MNERFINRNTAQDCSCESVQRNGTGRTKLLRKIQEYNFMMIEAALYLNNQPCCEAAQETFCKYRQLYLETLAEYEACYGPLTYSGADVKRDGWKWVDSPWPWEVEDC